MGVPKRSLVARLGRSEGHALDPTQTIGEESAWLSNCAGNGMNCPICNIGLKIAGHRGVSVNYCPLCGGTWLDKAGFDRLSSVAKMLPQGLRVPRRLLRIGILTALILAGCLITAISVGAFKLWPTVRGWAEAVLTGKEISLPQEVRQLASRLDPRLSRLSQAGLDSATISALLGNSSFEPLLRSVLAAPELGPFIKDGTYLKVLQEAGRQNVQTLADLKTAEIVPADVRTAAERIQQLLRSAQGAKAIGAVDPTVIGLLGSEAFQQLCRSGFFDSVLSKEGRAGE
jgi:uncharacterized protein (UPF0147 family)